MDKSLELIQQIKETYKQQMFAARKLGRDSRLMFNDDFQDMRRSAEKNWFLLCKIEKVLIEQSLDDADFENSSLKAYLDRFSK